MFKKLKKQKGGLIPPPQSFKPPVPDYNFSVLNPGDGTAQDSANYRYKYNNILANDPFAISQMQKLNEGIVLPYDASSKKNTDLYNIQSNSKNAYNDAAGDQWNQFKRSTMQDVSNYKNFKKQQGGTTPRKVDAVPDGFSPLRVDGNKSYYNKLGATGAVQQAQAGSAQAGDETTYMQNLSKKYPGVDPNTLQQKGYLSVDGASRYKSYYKPNEDVVYTEKNQAPAPVPTPAYAQRGEPMYDNNKHITGEMFYPSRNSSTQSDGGMLNTQQVPARFKFRNDFGYTGQELDLQPDEIQKYFGTTNTLQGDSYNTLMNRAKQLSMKKKGGWSKMKNPYC